MKNDNKRAARREKQKSKQSKRIKNLRIWFDCDLNEKELGRLRDHHYRCGCAMCKPWKHGLDEELKPSERRKLQPTKDESI